MTHESAKFETFQPFCLLFHTGMWKDFQTTDSIESRCVIGPEKKLFAGVCVHLSAQKFYMLGSDGLNRFIFFKIVIIMSVYSILKDLV